MNAERPMHVRFREAMARAVLAPELKRARKPGNPYDRISDLTAGGVVRVLTELNRSGAHTDLVLGLKMPLERLVHAIHHGDAQDRYRWLGVVHAFALAIHSDAERLREMERRCDPPNVQTGLDLARPIQERKDIFG